MTPDDDRWGPWSYAISHPELLTRLKVLRAFSQRHVPRGHVLLRALRQAESGERVEIEAARHELNRLPARTYREIVAGYLEHWRYGNQAAERKVDVEAV